MEETSHIRKAFEIGKRIVKHERVTAAIIFGLAIFLSAVVLGAYWHSSTVYNKDVVTDDGWRCKELGAIDGVMDLRCRAKMPYKKSPAPQQVRP